MGEDARTEPSTLFLHNGEWISLSISKEHSWGKVEEDCIRCQKTRRQIDILVFVTAGNPRTDTIERWKQDVSKSFNWVLEVRTIEFLAPYASRPNYEDLVDDYLSIPPLNGDGIRDIEQKVSQITSRNFRQIRNTIPGLRAPINRQEVDQIEQKLATGKNVIITGDAGVGKSGLVPFLAQNGDKKKRTILLDARQLGSFQLNADLRAFFDFKGPAHLAILKLSRQRGCRLIIDQLDNIAGLPSSFVVLDFIDALTSSPSSLEIVAVCRNKEQYEHDILRRLIESNFEEQICRPISLDDVKRVLSEIGISNLSNDMTEFCMNLLNLELVGQIRAQEPDFDFSMLTDEVHLWEKYIDVWRLKEGRRLGDEMLKNATSLAKLGLQHPDGIFLTDFPHTSPLQRLISWDIISPIEKNVRLYRFRHEKFQDFIYAKDATERWLMPKDILSEILAHKSRNIFNWVNLIYQHNGSEQRIKFLKEAFNV